jgi:arginine decarboxylase
VVQALVEPGDMVLIDRDCHKSHHYGMAIERCIPVYLHSYPLPKYSMYGAVPLEHIRERCWSLKRAASGKREDAAAHQQHLRRCGVQRGARDGTGAGHQAGHRLPVGRSLVRLRGLQLHLRQRTAMHAAQTCTANTTARAYRAEYEAHIASLAKGEEPRLPDPDKVRIRVYATQSTHKTLTSFRQGSMIHIWDEDFKRKSEAASTRRT